MADLKIRIEGDASGATKALEDVKNSSDFTWKSISQLTNNLQKVDKAFLAGKATAEDLDKAQRQLINAFERFSNAAIIGGNEAKAYSEIVKKANSVIQKLDANVKSVNLSDTFKNAAKEAQKFQNELEKSKATYENTLAKNKATALGDKYTLYSLEYKELDKQLTKILEREGQVTDESKKLASQMVKLKESMDKAGRTDLTTRMKNLVSSFVSAQAVIWAIRKAFTTFTKVITESASAASKAEETANLFNTTFSNIESSANSVANSLSSSLGMATSSAQQMIGLFGDLAMGYGQTQTAALEFANQAVQTGLDLISFKNLTGDTTELLQTMASGLAGNFENFRKWGIIVTQAEIKQRLAQKGLDKLTGSAYQYAKVQETLAIVQEKSKNATGDMAKTLESTENINRRLSETNKELLENMGRSVNKVLNPVKKAWIDIVTEINKATKAQREYAEGSKDINVYDIKNNEKDRKTFNKEVRKTLDWQYLPDQYDTEDIVNQLKAVMTMFGASVEDFEESLKYKTLTGKERKYPIDDSIVDAVKSFIKASEKEKEVAKAFEKSKSNLENLTSEAINFLDSLNEIQGVQTKTTIKPYESENYKSAFTVDLDTRSIPSDVKLAIEQAISSLDNTVWEDFADPIKLALGEITEDKAIESKLSSIEALYEAIYNHHLKDGELTAQELKDLEKIADKYKELQKEQTRKADLTSALANVSGMNKSADLATYGLSGKELDLYNLDAFYEAAKAIASTAEEQKALNRSYLEATKSIDKYYEAVEKQKKADEEATRQKEAAEAEEKRASNAQELIEEWQKKVFQFGMSERTVQQNDLARELIKGTYTDNEYNQIVKYMNEYFDSEEATAKAQEFQDMITGAFGGAMDMFNSMSSGAGWVGILMDLISQTEVYTEMMSILSDNVLPVLNAFLEPLLPLIEELGSVIILITKSVLEPLFPVLKAIAKIAVFVIGMLKITFGFVEDVIKKIVGTVQYGVLTVYNWIVRTLKKINIFGWQPFGWMGEADTTQAKEWMETDILGNARDRWDEMNEHLASIDKMTMDIEKNTSKSDTKAYDDMYNKGVLSFSEYTALLADINGKKYDNVYTLSGSEYYRGSGGTTNINYGGIEIKIDGTNLSADQIAEKVQKKLEEMKRPGQMAYA